MRLAGLEFVTEYQFRAGRRWRFDFAIPELRIGIECEGGIWLPRGRHTYPTGYENDIRKYNAAAVDGWKVLRFTRLMIESGEALETILEAISKP